MLVVTTTVRMVHGVHADTGHSGESFSLAFEFVEKSTSLHDGLLVSTSTGNDADSGSAVAVDGLTGA